jgi:3-hydroxyacyl-CoA dehydrogenase/enoyl-CoA hydratase/3-hydroxybutyryl-CoA epimerase
MNYPIIEKVAILGGGNMGAGIAALIVRNAGLPVVIIETPERVKIVRENILKQYASWIPGAKDIVVTSDVSAISGAGLVIEAVLEDARAKRDLYQKIVPFLGEETIIGSNTSAIPITALAEVFPNRTLFIGTHFSNPATNNKLKLVEVIRGERTSDWTVAVITRFLKGMLKKTPVVIKDRPGFLQNVLLMPNLEECFLGVEEAAVSPEAIDAVAIKNGWPMGRFALADMVGFGVVKSVGLFMEKSYPARMKLGTVVPVLMQMGRNGFYGQGLEPIDDVLAKLYPNRRTDITAETIYNRAMAATLNEAVRAVEENVASLNDIETTAQQGLGWPGAGPLHMVDDLGAGTLLATLESYEKEYGERFAPCALLRKMAPHGGRFFEADEW